jgi:hypothetical protein
LSQISQIDLFPAYGLSEAGIDEGYLIQNLHFRTFKVGIDLFPAYGLSEAGIDEGYLIQNLHFRTFKAGIKLIGGHTTSASRFKVRFWKALALINHSKLHHVQAHLFEK